MSTVEGGNFEDRGGVGVGATAIAGIAEKPATGIAATIPAPSTTYAIGLRKFVVAEAVLRTRGSAQRAGAAQRTRRMLSVAIILSHVWKQ